MGWPNVPDERANAGELLGAVVHQAPPLVLHEAGLDVLREVPVRHVLPQLGRGVRVEATKRTGKAITFLYIFMFLLGLVGIQGYIQVVQPIQLFQIVQTIQPDQKL